MGMMAAVALAALAGMLVGISCCEATIRHLRQKNRILRAIIRDGATPAVKPETMKRVLWACVINGFMWVWCSYILAALDKPQIAEELSKVALAEIIVPVSVYAGKSLVENLSKNNHWPDKQKGPEAELEDRQDDEPQEPPESGGVG